MSVKTKRQDIVLNQQAECMDASPKQSFGTVHQEDQIPTRNQSPKRLLSGSNLTGNSAENVFESEGDLLSSNKGRNKYQMSKASARRKTFVAGGKKFELESIIKDDGN